jgi:hypothetical protein
VGHHPPLNLKNATKESIMKNNDQLLAPAPLPDGSMPEVEFAPQRARPRSAQDILNRCSELVDTDEDEEEQKRHRKEIREAMAVVFPNHRHPY